VIGNGVLRWVASPSPQHNPLDGLKRDGE
jgi:hypothetical protein